MQEWSQVVSLITSPHDPLLTEEERISGGMAKPPAKTAEQKSPDKSTNFLPMLLIQNALATSEQKNGQRQALIGFLCYGRLASVARDVMRGDAEQDFRIPGE